MRRRPCPACGRPMNAHSGDCRDVAVARRYATLTKEEAQDTIRSRVERRGNEYVRSDDE